MEVTITLVGFDYRALVAFLKDNEYKIIKNKTYNLFLTVTLVEWMGERFGLQRAPICSRYCITTM